MDGMVIEILNKMVKKRFKKKKVVKGVPYFQTQN